ncbi:hypothetical protein ACFZBU_11695 [Embleya sp. NPDC008237]
MPGIASLREGYNAAGGTADNAPLEGVEAHPVEEDDRPEESAPEED